MFITWAGACFEFFNLKENKNKKFTHYLKITPGSGGDESKDLMKIICNILEKHFSKNNVFFEIKETDFDIKIFFKNKELELDFILGLWKFTRPSPFSKTKKIHTSFCKLNLMECLDDYTLSIKDSDLKWDFYKSSGPGGQNKNKTLTAVRLTFLPLNIVTTSTSQRSQLDNKKQARVQIEELLWERFNAEKEGLKQNKWEESGVNQNANISCYFNHNLVVCEKTNNRTSNLSGFLSGEIELIK